MKTSELINLNDKAKRELITGLDIGKYLNRIEFKGTKEPTIKNLFLLQDTHNKNVPYENLDIMNNIRISLEIPDIYDKIVNRKRGGYCFELNGIFGWLLRSLGYDVNDYFARYLRDEPEIPMRRHRVLLVSCENETFLCDVGIGSAVPLLPIKFLLNEPQPQNKDIYRLIFDDFLGYVLEEFRHDEWLPLFSFTTEKQLNKDFLATHWYCETHPDSCFRAMNLVSMRTDTGRKILEDKTFKIFVNENVTVFTVENQDDFNENLKKLFNIEL